MFTMRRVEFKTNALTVDQFDACVVMVKHWVADGFTPNETFQVNRKERVGFIIQEEHTCALEKKKGVSPYGDMVISGINKSHSTTRIINSEGLAKTFP